MDLADLVLLKKGFGMILRDLHSKKTIIYLSNKIYHGYTIEKNYADFFIRIRKDNEKIHLPLLELKALEILSPKDTRKSVIKHNDFLKNEMMGEYEDFFRKMKKSHNQFRIDTQGVKIPLPIFNHFAGFHNGLIRVQTIQDNQIIRDMFIRLDKITSISIIS